MDDELQGDFQERIGDFQIFHGCFYMYIPY